MKLGAYWIDEEDGVLKIRLESENQKESAHLIRLATRCKSPVKTYGSVGIDETWVWFLIPVTKEGKVVYFGTDKEIVKA